MRIQTAARREAEKELDDNSNRDKPEKRNPKYPSDGPKGSSDKLPEEKGKVSRWVSDLIGGVKEVIGSKAKKVIGEIAGFGAKAAPIGGAIYTYETTEGSAAWKALNAVGGEIGVGSVDVQTLGEGLASTAHLTVEHPESLLLMSFPPAYAAYSTYHMDGD